MAINNGAKKKITVHDVMRRKPFEFTRSITLAELYAVIAVAIVLILLLMPVLQGIVRTAREQKALSEARYAVITAQSLATELYGKGSTDVELPEQGRISFVRSSICTGDLLRAEDTGMLFCAAVDALSEAGGQVLELRVSARGVLLSLEYAAPNGVTVYYDGSDFHIVVKDKDKEEIDDTPS